MASASPPTLDELRRLAPTLQGITAAHGALGLQVFGSVVHGSARPGSDLDLLVEFPASPSGLIQSVSQALLPGLRAWVEVGGIAPSQCPKAFLPQPISI